MPHANNMAAAWPVVPNAVADRRRSTLHAADRILSIVLAHFPIRSIVDFGCGTGTWLSSARALGVDDVLGYEAARRKTDDFDEADLPITIVDLERPLDPGRRFDLAVSLEVGEHLSNGRSASFVADLCRASDRVLFSAAIPGQGGLDHVNEQWQSYWAGLFADCGYCPIDLVRPQIWHDNAIPVWYRQNLLLYLRDQEYRRFLETADLALLTRLQHVDLVHPALFQRRGTADFTGLVRAAWRNPVAFSQAVRRRLTA